jgi:hypothetical protein
MVEMLWWLLLLGVFIHPISSILCTPQRQHFELTTSQAAVVLATAASCENGVIDVTWSGDIKVPQTIEIGNGTVMTITAAASSSAILNGDSSVQLLQVNGGKLILNGINLRAAYSNSGSSAIHALPGSEITAVGCRFSGKVCPLLQRVAGDVMC